MPRRRPGELRAGYPRQRRTQGAQPSIDGMSAHAVRDVVRLEDTRNYLEPGDVILALDRWQQFVRSSEGRQWDECEWDDVHWYCCGNPLEGRVLLDKVMHALPPRSARELRALVSRYDRLASAPALAAPTSLEVRSYRAGLFSGA
ncbi:hypothetical protein ABZ128_10485 [Streptomyces sp. NPDC006326]|uniref:hypothetical protein n=1 Tax=Streptomyces sp. NPDC006326 TaxID=3156752 RepID=UPI0033B27CE7